MVPNGWDVIKLRDVGKCLTGLTYSPKNVVDNGLLVLRSSNVQDSKLAFEDNVYVDLDVPKEGRTKYGDILLCVRNGSRRLIGKSAFITQEAEGYAHGAFMGLFRPIDTPDYTFQLFQSESFFKQVNQNLGATINSINSGNLYDFKFPYPPIQEREKIAKILSTWDKAISTTERLIENSTQQKKALMQQLLTGKKRLLDESGKRFEGDWDDGKLADFAKIKKGKALSSKDLKEGSYPVIAGGKSSPYNHSDFTHENIITVSASGAYAGYVAYFDYKIWASDCSVVEPKGDNSIKYIYYWLTNQQQKIYTLQSGGAQPHIYPKDLESMKIAIPNLKEQQKIATVLTNTDKEIELLEQQLADLQQEKKALMQVLLTGKKRVLVDGEV